MRADSISNDEPLATWLSKRVMQMFEQEEYIDISIAQNKVIEERNADLELMREFDRNMEDEEE